MIDRLDRYVARYFASAWVVSLVFFVGLFGVYDFFSHVDDLVDQLGAEGDLGAFDVVRLYLLQTPAILLQVAPFVMVSAALVTLMQLQRHNEFAAMVLTGRSPRRVLRAVIWLTVIFALVLVWVQEALAPSVAQARDELRWLLVEDGKERIIERVDIVDTNGRLVVAFGFNPRTQVVTRISTSYVDDDERDVIVTGEDARWADDARGWMLMNGRSEISRGPGQPTITDVAPFLPSDVRPEDLMAQVAQPFDLPYSRVLERSERYPKNRFYRFLRHYHITFPLGVVAIVLLSLPFVVNPSPAGRLKGLGISILLVMGYFVLTLGARQLGQDGAIQPVVAAWFPVILTGSLVVVLFDGME